MSTPTRQARQRRALAVVLALALVVGGCSSDGGDEADSDSSRPEVDSSVETIEAGFEVRPGVEIATVTGAEPGHDLTLVQDDTKLLTLVSDDAGQANFAYIPDTYTTFETGKGGALSSAAGRELAPGSYTIRDESADPVAVSEPFEVLARDDHAPEAFYDDQEIGEGFGYVTMRDGVQLSINVRLPGPVEEGPYPTVVEYSGYGVSNPDATEPGSMIAGLFGYATVGVNMRGTGCSGGVFDVFSPAQQADGYDAIEAIAAQRWVMGNKVGMVGLSYSGIAQLYAASTQPPSLAAITPLSVIQDAWLMAWPGGIYNSGFTEQWLAQRNAQAESGGTDWVAKLIDEGDTTCEDNLEIRSQNPNFGEFTRALENRPLDADSRDLGILVQDIDVPVFLSGAWQDEQTGPQFGSMLDNFDNAPVTRFTLFNGRHPDGYSPLVLTRWLEFLELYVHEEVPRIDQGIRDAAPAFLEDFFGAPGLELEPDRFADFADDDLEGVRAAYEAEPDVRVLFENGVCGEIPGAPVACFETTFDSWPPPEATPRTWYFGADGALVDDAPDGDGADTFTNDPDAGQLTFFAEEDDYELLAPTWDFDWQHAGEGDAVSYVTEPFATDTVIAGEGDAALWVRADSPDADVQVTVTAINPDGTEWAVQSGQLRLSHRALDGKIGDDLEVEHLWDAESREPLVPGEWVEAHVAIPSFAQAFRAGTRLRVVISSPGRDRGTWKFDTIGDPGDSRDIGRGGEHASSITLAVVDGIEVPPGFPACPSLRGQACRDYVPQPNTAA